MPCRIPAPSRKNLATAPHLGPIAFPRLHERAFSGELPACSGTRDQFEQESPRRQASVALCRAFPKFTNIFLSFTVAGCSSYSVAHARRMVVCQLAHRFTPRIGYVAPKTPPNHLARTLRGGRAVCTARIALRRAACAARCSLRHQ